MHCMSAASREMSDEPEFAYFWYRATGSQADMKQEENKERSTAREAGGRTAGPRRFTPECITSLAPGEVFVFGSNLAGMHGGGAARVAMRHFGAVWGQGVGLQGQSYHASMPVLCAVTVVAIFTNCGTLLSGLALPNPS